MGLGLVLWVLLAPSAFSIVEFGPNGPCSDHIGGGWNPFGQRQIIVDPGHPFYFTGLKLNQFARAGKLIFPRPLTVIQYMELLREFRKLQPQSAAAWEVAIVGAHRKIIYDASPPELERWADWVMRNRSIYPILTSASVGNELMGIWMTVEQEHKDRIRDTIMARVEAEPNPKDAHWKRQLEFLRHVFSD